MADPVSIASAALAVAETGFRVASAIQSARNAEKQFQPIAEYVKLTSTVLEQIGSHLNDDQVRALYKPALLSRTDEALSGCKAAFGQLDD